VGSGGGSRSRVAVVGCIVNRMVQYQVLDGAFAALSDPTRRGILDRLGRGPASISELAAPFHMTITGVKKHVRILEDAHLLTSTKVGRVRQCRIETAALKTVEDWISERRNRWERRLDRLGAYLAENPHPPTARRTP
jgi:DNA-binding transcriptional ArsR family regulator